MIDARKILRREVWRVLAKGQELCLDMLGLSRPLDIAEEDKGFLDSLRAPGWV